MTTTAARATFVRTTQTMTYAAGRAAVDAALERAAELGVPVNVAVADPSGALLAFARMDGAPLLSSGIAQDKACLLYTSPSPRDKRQSRMPSSA